MKTNILIPGVTPVEKQHQPTAGIFHRFQIQITNGALKDHQAHSIAQHP